MLGAPRPEGQKQNTAPRTSAASPLCSRREPGERKRKSGLSPCARNIACGEAEGTRRRAGDLAVRGGPRPGASAGCLTSGNDSFGTF